MKKIYLAFIAMLAFNVAESQAQNYDVGCSAVLNPANGGTVISSTGFRLDYVRNNYGDPIPANHPDTLWMNFQLNGVFLARIRRDGANPFPQNAADTAGVTLNLPTPLPVGSHDLCIYTTFNGDMNPSNDTTCVSFTVVAADVAVTSLEIDDPMPVGDSFALGAILQNIRVALQNTSSFALPAGHRIQLKVSIDGIESGDLVLTLNGSLAPNASLNTNIPSSLTPALPIFAKDFDVCAFLTSAADPNKANDTICRPYKMFDPKASVEQLNSANQIIAFYNQEQVVVDLTLDNATDVQVILHNVAGQQIAQKNTRVFGGAEERVVMPTQNLSAGVYVVSVLTEGQMVGSTKLVVR